MKKNNAKRSVDLKFLIIGCFLLPIFALTISAATVASFQDLFFVAFFSAVLGLGLTILFLRTWEKRQQNNIAQQKLKETSDRETLEEMLAKSKEESQRRALDMDNKLEEMRIAYLEFEDLRQEYRRLEEEHKEMEVQAERDLAHKNSILNEYQRTIAEQRLVLEKKQRYIGKLEKKVQELVEEIRSLLQSEGIQTSASFQIELTEGLEKNSNFSTLRPTAYDLSILLHQHIARVEGLATSRFLKASIEKPALDLRPLFECFSEERIGVVFVYSPSDNRFLFINKHIKTLLGWPPEKFAKEFSHLLLSGLGRWKELMTHIHAKKEIQSTLVFQNNQGKAESVDCRAGMITKGPFANHVVGLFAHI